MYMAYFAFFCYFVTIIHKKAISIYYLMGTPIASHTSL